MKKRFQLLFICPLVFTCASAFGFSIPGISTILDDIGSIPSMATKVINTAVNLAMGFEGNDAQNQYTNAVTNNQNRPNWNHIESSNTGAQSSALTKAFGSSQNTFENQLKAYKAQSSLSCSDDGKECFNSNNAAALYNDTQILSSAQSSAVASYSNSAAGNNTGIASYQGLPPNADSVMYTAHAKTAISLQSTSNFGLANDIGSRQSYYDKNTKTYQSGTSTAYHKQQANTGSYNNKNYNKGILGTMFFGPFYGIAANVSSANQQLGQIHESTKGIHRSVGAVNTQGIQATQLAYLGPLAKRSQGAGSADKKQPHEI
jgi:hypothetical protein